jgi:hypothetical protein
MLPLLHHDGRLRQGGKIAALDSPIFFDLESGWGLGTEGSGKPASLEVDEKTLSHH